MGRKQVLVTGSDGQLGSSLLRLQNDFYSLELIPSDIADLDISNQNQVKDYLSSRSFDFVVNCAAFTAVDKAEQFESDAFAVNQLGPKNLAETCESLKIPLIHVSTDYVYSGESHIPYKENDLPGPLTAYGRSKLGGENSVLDSGVYGLIIRISWLYSEFGNNFVKSMLKLGSDRKELGVVSDQIGSPTYAGDLAFAILTIIYGFAEGNIVLEKTAIYNYCNQGLCSWYDFAQAVMDISDLDCQIHPITSEEFPRPAKRPHFSVLNTSLFRNKFSIAIPHWRDSLSLCIENLKT